MLAVIMLLIIVTCLYFIPSIIAYQTEKRNKIAILILNIFAGWTFIGWVIAIVWASMEDKN